MKRLLFKFTLAAALLVPGAAMAQSSTQRLDGTWIFRASFPGAPQPVYVGTAQFTADGRFSGPPIDTFTGPVVGEWIRTGNQEFAFTFLANTYQTTGGFQSTHRVRGIMTVSSDGLSAAGTTKLEVLNSAGQVIATAATAFTGARMVVEAF